MALARSKMGVHFIFCMQCLTEDDQDSNPGTLNWLNRTNDLRTPW